MAEQRKTESPQGEIFQMPERPTLVSQKQGQERSGRRGNIPGMLQEVRKTLSRIQKSPDQQTNLPELASYKNEHLAVEIQRVQEYFVDKYGILFIPVGGSVIRQLQQQTQQQVHLHEQVIDFAQVADVREKREDGTTVDIDAIGLSAHRETDSGKIVLDDYDAVLKNNNRSKEYLHRFAKAHAELTERQKRGGPPWSVESIQYMEHPEQTPLKKVLQKIRHAGKTLLPHVPQFVSKVQIFPPDYIDKKVHAVEGKHDPFGRIVFSYGPIKQEVSKESSFDLYTWRMHLADQTVASFLTFSPVGIRERFLGVRVPEVKEKDRKRVGPTSPIYQAAEKFRAQTDIDETTYQRLYGPWHQFHESMQTNHALGVSIKRQILRLWWNKKFPTLDEVLHGQTIGEYVAHRTMGDKFSGVR